MTELAIKYTLNPFYSFISKLSKIFEEAGRTKAAAELYRMGYREEAKNLMLRK